MKLINCTNKKLVAFLLSKGVKPMDIFLGRNDTIVFQYNPEQSEPFYKEWVEREHE